MSANDLSPAEVDMPSAQSKKSLYDDYLELLNRVDEENCTANSWKNYQKVINSFNINEILFLFIN